MHLVSIHLLLVEKGNTIPISFPINAIAYHQLNISIGMFKNIFKMLNANVGTVFRSSNTTCREENGFNGLQCV